MGTENKHTRNIRTTSNHFLKVYKTELFNKNKQNNDANDMFFNLTEAKMEWRQEKTSLALPTMKTKSAGWRKMG